MTFKRTIIILLAVLLLLFAVTFWIRQANFITTFSSERWSTHVRQRYQMDDDLLSQTRGMIGMHRDELQALIGEGNSNDIYYLGKNEDKIPTSLIIRYDENGYVISTSLLYD